MTDVRQDDPAALLAAQLADLARYRHVLEAQRAVLRMTDAGLLDHFTAEAGDILSGIVNRDAQLMSVRVVAQTQAAQGARAARLADLQAELQRARTAAGDEALRLASEISLATSAVSEAIHRSGRQLETVFRGYGGGSRIQGPTMIDRRV